MDAKTRKDLLKYIFKKKNTKKNLPVDDESVRAPTSVLSCGQPGNELSCEGC